MAKIFSKGIDLSEHQGSVDFNKLKATGIDFVLLRAGYGSANRYPEQYDTRFEEYYKKAKAAGLGVGAYWYSYAENADMAADEAASFIKALRVNSLIILCILTLRKTALQESLVKQNTATLRLKSLAPWKATATGLVSTRLCITFQTVSTCRNYPGTPYGVRSGTTFVNTKMRVSGSTPTNTP